MGLVRTEAFTVARVLVLELGLIVYSPTAAGTTKVSA